MKHTALPLFVSTLALAIQLTNSQDNSQAVITEASQRLIEFGLSETRWVTEAEKWDLRRDGQWFMDITDFQDLGTLREQSSRKNKFPKKVHRQEEITPLFQNLTKSNIQTHLEYFTTFHNRYYASEYGKISSKWLLDLVNETIKETGADDYGVRLVPFKHHWGQHSIIVTIPGKCNSTVVVGAHQDSVNHADRMGGRAPGSDDDGSGIMTILEVMRVLLSSPEILKGESQNTVEFHWYSAEEGGALGSQAIFSEYEKTGRDVKAMFQQDMTGFIKLTVEAGRKPEFGVMMDWIDEELMDYSKLIIEEYTDLKWIETGCGITCGSDHMSAIKAGYPAVFIIESDFQYCDNHLHGTQDLIKDLDFDHMIDHAKMALAFVYELTFASL